MPKTKRSANELICQPCGTTLLRNSKFCHKCGAPTAGRPAALGQNWKYLLSAIFVSVVSIGGIFLANRYSEKQEPARQPAPQINASPSTGQSAQTIDLSTMTPRQAADRLFNRVIAADERGDSQQVAQFAPMALEAYRLVERPDADLHYHMGLISLAVGDLDETRKQLQNIKQISPDHLLGMHLELRLAERGDADKSASEILERFAASYDAETKSGKPEYEAHSKVIEKLHTRATTSADAPK